MMTSRSKGPKSSAEARARVREVLRRRSARDPDFAFEASKSWEMAVSSAVGFLTRLKAAQALHGQVWKDKMMRYYGSKLSELLSHPPKGAEKTAAEFKRRYANLLPA